MEERFGNEGSRGPGPGPATTGYGEGGAVDATEDDGHRGGHSRSRLDGAQSGAETCTRAAPGPWSVTGHW